MEEVSLRLILASINREANKLGKAIKPLLSLRKNFYLRVGHQIVNKDFRGGYQPERQRSGQLERHWDLVFVQ